MQGDIKKESSMAIKRYNDRYHIRVFLWGREIGTLTWVPDRKLSYFFFSQEYFRQPYDICPLTNPKDSNSTRQAIYGTSLNSPYQEDKIYQGLPPFLADSLPDRWGNAIFDKWFADKKLPEYTKTPITKLSFLGKRAMGAFEFVPATETVSDISQAVNIQDLYEQACRFEEEMLTKSVSQDRLSVENLAVLGASPGGSRKKAIVSMSLDGCFRSGSVSTREDWKHYIIKFNTPFYSISETEYTYWELAREAGIKMMPSELLEIEGTKHFLTERFDRRDGAKVMMQTLAAINPEAHSYEDLFRTCRRLNIPMQEIIGLYRQTVFNFLLNNTDDHNKNFSFVMDKDFRWHLSPAYDVTFIIADNGIEGEWNHCLSLMGKFTDVTEEELVSFGKKNDIPKPESIIKDIRQISLTFEEKARKNGINGFCTEMISKRLHELGRKSEAVSVEQSIQLGATKLDDIHFEMSEKGNIHLCAKIDGQVKKIVLTSKKEVFTEIMQKGFNLMDSGEREAIFRKLFGERLKERGIKF